MGPISVAWREQKEAVDCRNNYQPAADLVSVVRILLEVFLHYFRHWLVMAGARLLTTPYRI